MIHVLRILLDVIRNCEAVAALPPTAVPSEGRTRPAALRDLRWKLLCPG